MRTIKCTKTFCKDIPGFTIIEIIAVLVVIGILTAVAVPSIVSLATDKVDTEVEILKANLYYAQSRAMCDDVTWGIAFGGTSYTLQKNGITAPSNLPAENSPTHLLETDVSVAGTTVTYDRWGSPGAVSQTITVSGGISKSITVTKNTGFIQ